MEFRILGALEVVDGSRLVDVGSAAKKSLLAILLLHPNQVSSVDRLVDDLWADSPPPGAWGTLQTYIRALRRTLEPEGHGGCYQMLITRPPGYLLQLELPHQLDAARFETLVAAGRRSLDQGDFAGAATTLRKALELWRGAALADFCYKPFAEAEAMRLEETRLDALECRVEADLGAGRRGELVGELEALVSQHPLREGFWRQLMLASTAAAARRKRYGPISGCANASASWDWSRARSSGASRRPSSARRIRSKPRPKHPNTCRCLPPARPSPHRIRRTIFPRRCRASSVGSSNDVRSASWWSGNAW